MRFALLIVAVTVGCGSSRAATAVDAGPPEGGAPDAAIVYCSSNCGTVDAGTDGSYPCLANDICGQTGGVSGFICCNPSTCSPGNPGPGDCP